MSGHITRIVASCGPRGRSKEVERMLEAVGQDEAQALALLGDLGAGEVRECGDPQDGWPGQSSLSTSQGLATPRSAST